MTDINGFTLTDPFTTVPALSSSLDNSGGYNTSLPSGVSGENSGALIPSTGNSFLDSVASLTALGTTTAVNGINAYTSFLNAKTAQTLAAKGQLVPSNTSAVTVPLNNVPAQSSSNILGYAAIVAGVFLLWEVLRRKG